VIGIGVRVRAGSSRETLSRVLNGLVQHIRSDFDDPELTVQCVPGLAFPSLLTHRPYPRRIPGFRARRRGADIAKLELVGQSCFDRHTNDRYRRYSAHVSTFLRALRGPRSHRDMCQAGELGDAEEPLSLNLSWSVRAVLADTPMTDIVAPVLNCHRFFDRCGGNGVPGLCPRSQR